MRPALALSLALATALVGLVGPAHTAHAEDTWTTPFPGVQRLHRRTADQNVNALVVDLCAAGTEMRATASSERRQTPSSFGRSVGAQAAINGDFFSYDGYSTNGVAMHAGVQWPGTSDHGYVGPVAFGDGRAEIVPHGEVAGPEPWMREIVSGHPTILLDGVVRPHTGDPLCSNRHPRTVIGLSADQATLYIAVIDGRASTRLGMTCAEEARLMRELGADDAVNMDGGGSSAMWLSGRGVVSHPSDGSERVVANHLAVYARGSGTPAHCPDFSPNGWLDAAKCDGVRGWAQDPDVPDEPIDVHLYFDGPAGADGALGVPVTADVRRDDLCDAIGSCAHGFSRRPPRALMDGAEHEVFAYGIDGSGGDNAMLQGAPKTMRCDPPEPPLAIADGVLRHVESAAVMEAWGFSFHEVAPLGSRLDGWERADAWPETLELVRAEGDGAVYAVDGELKRHVSSPAVMEAWGFSWDAVRDVPAAEVEALRDGPPLMNEPFLARGEGPAVYVIDHAIGAAATDGGTATRDGGATDRDAGPGTDAGGEPRGDAGMTPTDGSMTGGCAAASGRGGTLPALAFALLLLSRCRRAGRRRARRHRV